MKRKRFWLIKPIHILLMVMCLLLCGTLFFLNRTLFYVAAPLVLLTVVYSLYKMLRIQRDLYKMITSMGTAMTDSSQASLINFPLPAVIVNDINEIIWYNDMFRQTVLSGKRDLFGAHLRELIPQEIPDLIAAQGTVIRYDGRHFKTYCLKTTVAARPLYFLYLVDITELEEIRLESIRTKPVVMLILIDNYEETINNENENSKENLLAEVRSIVQEFVDKTSGFLRKLDRDRYLVVLEHCDLQNMIQNRFDILDRVRELTTESRVPITLSIGVAPVKDTLTRAERESRQALDMALGRGGDQAAVKTDGGFEFFGGYSKGVEKQTKVKTRIVASALVELVKAADNVLVMGHKFSDLDALGACIGMAKACRCFSGRVNIVLDSRRNLADVLVQKLVQAGEQELLMLPEMALETVTDKTLLIIVDTHTDALLESKTIYQRCKQVVVIDHHRKMVNHIDNAVIFYHEPYASSASEMVTELVQYFGDQCRLGRTEAEALLSGIMLDTKNFVIKTGVRTFEAAAYLRRLGADTIEVRQLFSSTMDSYQRKSRIVSSAKIYKGCAIASADFVSDDLRIVAPQAADELLGISGVKASFVLYEENDTVNISARSMGALNVQLVMETLGGGGHHTMAGAQVPNSTCDKVRQSLLEVIDKQILLEK